MAQSTTPEQLLPLESLNVSGYLAQLRALQRQAEQYARMGGPVIPGIPDIPAMIRALLQQLLREIERLIRQYINQLFQILMAKAAKAVIPIINDILRLINSVIKMINRTVAALFPPVKMIFQIIVVLTIVWVVAKIIGMIPSMGVGMGSVVVFTPFLTVVANIRDGAEKGLNQIRPVSFAIIAVMLEMIKYYNYIQMVYGMIKAFIQQQLGAAAEAAQIGAATAAELSETDNPVVDHSLAGDAESELIECTLPSGEVQMLDPQTCLDSGGTFPGSNLVDEINDLNEQINSKTLELDELIKNNNIVDCLLPDGTISQIKYNECIEAGGRALTQDELNKLKLDRDNLLNELGYLSGLQFDSNVITSLKNPDSSVTVEDVTERKGKRYGFYQSYKRIKRKK